MYLAFHEGVTGTETVRRTKKGRECYRVCSCKCPGLFLCVLFKMSASLFQKKGSSSSCCASCATLTLLRSRRRSLPQARRNLGGARVHFIEMSARQRHSPVSLGPVKSEKKLEVLHYARWLLMPPPPPLSNRRLCACRDREHSAPSDAPQ